MQKIKNITGIAKTIFLLKMKICIFFHFLPNLIKRKITLCKYFAYLRRLLYFLSKMKHNKFVKIGKNTRIGLYIPGFSAKPFYTACKKFMVFGKKFPCATVLVSITSACRYHCKHCYQKYDKGKDIEIEKLVETVRKLQNMGIAFFNIEGGEPFLVYDRLKKVCQAIDNRSEIWINSTGDGITIERLLELKKLNVTSIMFSLHSPDPAELNMFMGVENAWQTMAQSIELCHKAEISVALNLCLPKDDFYNGRFEKIIARAKEFKAAFLQLIKPKPAGGWLETGVASFTEENINHCKKQVEKYNTDRRYKNYPAISAQIIEEDKNVFGCTAGGTDRFYINAKGDVQPCEFLNISFGNILQEEIEKIYTRMRDYFKEPGECWLCEKYSTEILRLFKENNLKSLPLDVDLSKTIYNNWDRGKKTELYQHLKNMV